MKKLYVIELEEISCCGDCKLRRKGEDSCPLYSEFKGCPLTELKPKELVWLKEGDYLVAKIGAIAYYLLEDDDYDENTQKENKSITLWIEITTDAVFIEDESEMSDVGIFDIEKAKQFCQNNYNNLFWKMVGGENV